MWWGLLQKNKFSSSRKERATSNPGSKEGLTKEMVFKLNLETWVEVYKVKGGLRQKGKVGSAAQKNKKVVAHWGDR